MIKYALLEDGSYKDTETGATGIRPGVWQYEAVEKWLKAGNKPIPVQPSPDHSLVDDVWVLNPEKKKVRELGELQQQIHGRMLDFHQLLIDLFATLITTNIIKVEDLPLETQAIWVDLEDKMGKIKAKKARKGIN